MEKQKQKNTHTHTHKKNIGYSKQLQTNTKKRPRHEMEEANDKENMPPKQSFCGFVCFVFCAYEAYLVAFETHTHTHTNCTK